MLCFGANRAAARELELLDGTRIRSIGLSFNQEGAVALRAGEATSLTFSWVEISPDCLSPDQRRQQEAFVGSAINKAKASAPAEAKQIIRRLAPLVTRMDPATQERLGWLDVQIYLSAPELRPMPNLAQTFRTMNSPFWRPDFAACPSFDTIKAEFPARWQQLVTTLRGNATTWRTFLITIGGGTLGLFVLSFLRGPTSSVAESAQRRITFGVVASVSAALVMLVLSLSLIFPILPVRPPFGCWSLLDIVVLLLLSLGLARRSSLAAFLLLLHSVLLLLRHIWVFPVELAGTPGVLGLTVLHLVCIVGALRGAIEYQRT